VGAPVETTAEHDVTTRAPVRGGDGTAAVSLHPFGVPGRDTVPVRSGPAGLAGRFGLVGLF